MSSVADHVVHLRDYNPREAGARISSAVSSLGSQLVDGVQAWGTKAKGAARTTDRFVRTSPWQAAGVVTVAALAAAVVAARVRRARRARSAAVDDCLSGG
jgi:ElaB/YqjD/DUF883 family membrane-anchored ribosome-binding protein